MESKPTLTYRNMDSSPSIETLVRRRIGDLERFHARLTGCDVVIEATQARKHNAKGYRVRVNLHLPGPDISVAREVAQGAARDDVLLAMNRAFSAAEKKLKQQKQVMNALHVKSHPDVLHGRITDLEPELGYGYLRADDGREVYFQRDSFETGDWDQLQKGMRLRFREEQGENGPFATNVSPAG